MLKLISPVSDVFRKDFEIDTTYLTTDPTYSGSAKAIAEGGLWVKLASQKAAAVQDPNGASASTPITAISTGAGNAGVMYVQIWNDKGDYGAQALNKVTTLFLGQYEAVTDKYAGTPGEGDYLTVSETGALVVAALAGQIVVAQCTKYDSTAGLLTYVRLPSAFPLQ